MRALLRRLEEGYQQNSRAIATEILRQLGGNRFLAMTGAKDLVSFDVLDDQRKWPGIAFKLPIGNAKYIKIALSPDDTYTIQFMTRAGRMIKEIDDIYADQLQFAIEHNTGLALSL